MRELKGLIHFFEARQNETMVLATIVSTSGSTYCKAGAKKLITLDKRSQGLLSGGCLESDIIEFALKDPSLPRIQKFNTMTDEDRLFGSGIGCKGEIEIFFESLDSKAPNPPLTFLGFSKAQMGKNYLCINQKSPDFGKRLSISQNNEILFSNFQTPPETVDDSLFADNWSQDLHIKIIGSGLDIPPLYEFSELMGWSTQVLDYRKDQIEERKKQNWDALHIDSKDILRYIREPSRTVVLVMSHNYPFDLDILNQLTDTKLGFLGVLGPPDRKQQLLNDLNKVYDKTVDEEWAQNLHGPIGLNHLGRGETAIGLSIAAQLQQIFFSDL